MSKVPSYFRQDGKDQVQTGKYGYRIHPVTGAKQDFHTGGDYRSASGTPLVSPCDGVVTLAKLYTTGYGGRVLIFNEVANVTLAITHMEKLSVTTGQVVKKGQLIGSSGGAKGDKYAGTSTGAHLHISVIKDRAASIPGKEDRFYHDPEKFDWKTLEPKPKPNVLDIGDKVSFSGFAFTQANGGKQGRVNHKDTKGVISAIVKGAARPYHVANDKGSGIGWVTASQVGASDPVKPTPTSSIKVGSKVKINKGAYYQGAAKGKKVSTYALLRTHTVDKIDKGNARLQPINSWVALKDLKAV